MNLCRLFKLAVPDVKFMSKNKIKPGIIKQLKNSNQNKATCSNLIPCSAERSNRTYCTIRRNSLQQINKNSTIRVTFIEIYPNIDKKTKLNIFRKLSNCLTVRCTAVV